MMNLQCFDILLLYLLWTVIHPLKGIFNNQNERVTKNWLRKAVSYYWNSRS